MGMSCAQGGENSYGEVTVTGNTLRIAYKDENGNTLHGLRRHHPLRPVRADALNSQHARRCRRPGHLVPW